MKEEEKSPKAAATKDREETAQQSFTPILSHCHVRKLRIEFTLINPISFQIHKTETNHATASLLLFFFSSELPAHFWAQS